MNTNLKMLAALAAITLTSPVATLYATVGGQEVSQAVMTIRGNKMIICILSYFSKLYIEDV